MVFQLQRFVTALAQCHTDNHRIMKDNQLFPIEVDLSRGIFNYNTTGQMPTDEDCYEDDRGSSVDTSPRLITTVKKEVGESPSVVSGRELVGTASEVFSPSLLLDSGDREDLPKLERDLFDFFLDSPISLSANSSISSILKKSSDQPSKVVAESEFNPFECFEEIGASHGQSAGFEGWFGDDSDANNNSNAAVQDCPRNCYDLKDYTLPTATSNKDAPESSNLGDPTRDCVHLQDKNEFGASNNSNVLEGGDDLDEDFFFEAISSRFPSEEFIKDFMDGTQMDRNSKVDLSDKDEDVDNDDKMLKIEEDDKARGAMDARNQSDDIIHASVTDHNEATKDDNLIKDVVVCNHPQSAETLSDDDTLLVCIDSS